MPTWGLGTGAATDRDGVLCGHVSRGRKLSSGRRLAGWLDGLRALQRRSWWPSGGAREGAGCSASLLLPCAAGPQKGRKVATVPNHTCMVEGGTSITSAGAGSGGAPGGAPAAGRCTGGAALQRPGLGTRRHQEGLGLCNFWKSTWQMRIENGRIRRIGASSHQPAQSSALLHLHGERALRRACENLPA